MNCRKPLLFLAFALCGCTSDADGEYASVGMRVSDAGGLDQECVSMPIEPGARLIDDIDLLGVSVHSVAEPESLELTFASADGPRRHVFSHEQVFAGLILEIPLTTPEGVERRVELRSPCSAF